MGLICNRYNESDKTLSAHFISINYVGKIYWVFLFSNSKILKLLLMPFKPVKILKIGIYHIIYSNFITQQKNSKTS